MGFEGNHIQRMYRTRFPDEAQKAKEKIWETLVRFYFQRWIRPSDTVLDLGCGFGEFLNALRCARRIGVDMNPDSRNHLHPGIEFHEGNICDLNFLPENIIDLVFISNVIEHLPNKFDAERMLGEVYRVLRRGGQLIVMGPNLRFLPTGYWDFWDHYIPVTDRSLAEILGVLGFQMTGCIPRFIPFTTHSAIPQNPWLVKLYLKLPLLWPIFGRQFLIHASKAGESGGIKNCP